MLAWAFPVSADEQARVDFNRDIRPILTKDCTACHGGVKAAGGISFIYRDQALAKGESGATAIVPGKPEQSEMMRRLRSSDPDDVMPKPKHGPPLGKDQIALIERWIKEGAEWQEHWSFVPPREVTVGKLSDESWPTVPFDRHVLQRLDREGMKPSLEAPPEEWLRRVSFDLIGLPPTPDELMAFQAAMAKDPAAAREAVVDRLLASPHFGERWAVMWMDLARYSDTFGFEKDPERTIWPYRDWLIRSFNADMPYDQFTIEQLAGDLLPGATADQRLATAFHRNTQNNTEGGTDDEEFRVAAVIDRISTTWTVWQATTFGCVQCHSHPYDPIAHDEFYRFMAFFNNSEDHDLDNDYPGMKVAADPAEKERASTAEVQLREWREQLNEPGRELGEKDDQWRAWTPDQLNPTHGSLRVDERGMIHSIGTQPVGVVHELSGPVGSFQALRLQVLPESDDPKKWPERGSMVTKIKVSLVMPGGAEQVLTMREVFSDEVTGSIEMTPDGGLGAYPKLHHPRWFVLVPEQPVTAVEGARLKVWMLQKASTTGSQATPLRRYAMSLSSDDGWRRLIEDPARLALWDKRKQVAKVLAEIKSPVVPVMVEGPVRETRVFARGNRMSKEDLVTPGLPKLFGGQSAAGMTRLDMARWLVGKENPLTARVMVNRLWQELFGTGIVKTAEDFGTSGTMPSHPELLDHLALRFRDHHQWSIKRMLREIVLSSTYRQTHRADADLVRRDPENRLLARGPRTRLTAEMVRDQALSVAGLLSSKMHGPPVFPPQPAAIWKSVYNGKSWKESPGEDRVRRAIYTYHKRTSAYPAFLTFDAPTRDLCTARRINSNTPLQALVTMNDPAHIEAAQGFAGRMIGHGESLDERLRHGYLLVTQQLPSSEVLKVLVELHADALQAYRDDPAQARHLAESPEAAAMVLVANTLLNLDSALTR